MTSRSIKSRLLITGASGFLGRAILAELASGDWPWDPIGLSQTEQTAAGIAGLAVDLRDRAATIALLDRLAPSAILHLAAEANPGRCEADPEASARVNVGVTETIADYCHTQNLPLVFTSTDLVFAGNQSLYSEADPVGPLSCYARQKVAAESLVLACDRSIVARMPVMFGSGASNFMATLVEGLHLGRSVSLFADEYRSPVSGVAAAKGLLQSIDWLQADRHRGLLHLGGADRLSRYEFGLLVAEVLGYDPSLLLPCSQADVAGLAPRPQDVSLDSGLAFGLGYGPGSVRSQLDGF
jgi:dTDP-4-dehydrorhamnose reductase